ncbi:3'-5' exonuclease [Bosea vaviloviae]|uniref:3'-5' exonuclease n=1 Tax=Bosea vaviloviae TaxID=1526658 RepID=UPI0009F63627|nr:3'-5' exonuclease [Bosea vaviloviae]
MSDWLRAKYGLPPKEAPANSERPKPPLILSDSARAAVAQNHSAVSEWVSRNKLPELDETPAPPAPEVAWIEKLPPYVIFLDVETTGLKYVDRIVSFAAIRLSTAALYRKQLDLSFMHLIFDPGINSHPQAQQAHGYSDWILRHQDPFNEHSAGIWKFIHRAPLIVAHNADFDAGFLDRAFRLAGGPEIARETFCTMRAYQNLGLRGGASLAAAGRTIGLARRNEHHGALEDAWLCMLIYLWLHGCPLRFPPSEELYSAPSNIRQWPLPPDGRLPRRKNVLRRSASLQDAREADVDALRR